MGFVFGAIWGAVVVVLVGFFIQVWTVKVPNYRKEAQEICASEGREAFASTTGPHMKLLCKDPVTGALYAAPRQVEG